MPASYRELKVWQESMLLVKEVYKFIDNLPEKERFALADQMRRSAISVPSNVAEGQGRGSDRDFARFVYIAKGSLCELETQLELCIMLGYFSREQLNSLFDLAAEIGKKINNLIKKLTISDNVKFG
ncbi:MAG: four helix bundle protein [Synergistaceae bacterium]|nr:four helix bundle protein [Candidatus Equadaptatus faecalis]